MSASNGSDEILVLATQVARLHSDLMAAHELLERVFARVAITGPHGLPLAEWRIVLRHQFADSYLAAMREKNAPLAAKIEHALIAEGFLAARH